MTNIVRTQRLKGSAAVTDYQLVKAFRSMRASEILVGDRFRTPVGQVSEA